jgi:phosphoglycolate phosphatase
MARVFLRGEVLMSAGSPADIHAVLFDKDGTMSKSEPQLFALASSRIHHCLNLARQSPQDEEGMLHLLLKKAYGLHPEGSGLDPAGITAVAARDHNLISTAVAFTLVGHGWPESLELAHEAFRLADLERPSNTAWAETTDGLREMLSALQACAVACAVISNDEASGIERFLENHGLAHSIGAIWSADHHPRKPDPRAIHQLCERMDVDPAECALIGDANSDLRMAQNAGVGVVLGYGGGWERPVALDPAFPLVEHWSELAVEAG